MRIWIEVEYNNGCMFRVYEDYDDYDLDDYTPPIGEWTGDEITPQCPGYTYLEMMPQNDTYSGLSTTMWEIDPHSKEVRVKAWKADE